MTAPIVPVDSKRTDWPRLVAQASGDAQKRLRTIEQGAGGLTIAKLMFLNG